MSLRFENLRFRSWTSHLFASQVDDSVWFYPLQLFEEFHFEEQTCIVEKWLKPPQTIKGVVNEENRYLRLITLPETDIAPKNGCLDATFLSGRPIFTGELLVSGRGMYWIVSWMIMVMLLGFFFSGPRCWSWVFCFPCWSHTWTNAQS